MANANDMTVTIPGGGAADKIRVTFVDTTKGGTEHATLEFPVGTTGFDIAARQLGADSKNLSVRVNRGEVQPDQPVPNNATVVVTPTKQDGAKPLAA